MTAESVEIEDGDEVFSIFVAPFKPDRHRSRPAFAPISPPDGLDLARLVGSPTQVRVVRSDVPVIRRGVEAHALVDASIMLMTAGGTRLLVDAHIDLYGESEAPVMPLDLVLATDASTIDALLSGRFARQLDQS